VLSTGAHWLDGLALQIAGLGVEFEVLEPPALVQRLGVLGARLTQAAERSLPTG
jgi:hypothetical protein